jgi:DNA helicase-2/ATP-dependent DNA helicase PcrA
MTPEQILSGLNDEQRAAVEATEGPVLVVAGAGAGKTRVLTARISLLIARGLAAPNEILAVTFTNKAAAEIRERVGHAVGAAAAAEIRMGSFHSVSLGMLRRHAKAAGLRDDRFAVLDEAEQKALLEGVCRDLGLLSEDARTGGRRDAEAFEAVRKAIDRWKEEGLLPEDVAADPSAPEAYVLAWKAYQETLARRNACDYADLLLHVLTLFRRDEEIRGYWARRFRYVLVDEFQDTNPLQYAWLRALCRDRRNLCVVGDPDQSIYEWRNARPAILENFAADWPGCRTFSVGRNYRSSQPILDVANAVVSRNPRVAGKRLHSGRGGAPVELKGFESHDAESRWIADAVAAEIAGGTPPEEIAVLCRAAYHLRPVEEQLLRRGIACEVSGGPAFLDREEIRDAIAILRLACDPSDQGAYARIADRPARGVGPAGAQAVLDALRRDARSLDVPAAMRQAAEQRHLPAGTRRALLDDADRWSGLVALARERTLDAGGLLQEALTRLGYISWRVQVGDLDANRREESLKALIAMGRGQEDPLAWLQELRLDAPSETQQAAKVRLMTIHAAKGLEFEVVFTPALEEDVLPNAQALAQPYGLAEERRLAHVAWTRAKRRLVVSWARLRAFKAARPSRFLVEAGLMDETTRQALSGPAVPKAAAQPGRMVLRAVRR